MTESVITIFPPYHDEYWQKIRPQVVRDLKIFAGLSKLKIIPGKENKERSIRFPHQAYTYPIVSEFARNMPNFSIVHMATHNGDAELLIELFEQWSFDAHLSNPYNPFYLAAIGGHKTALDVLTNYGKIYPNTTGCVSFMKENQGNHQWKPLHIVAAYGCSETIEALVQMGEDIEAQSECYGGMTPLMIAVSFYKIKTVGTFLRLGANIDVTFQHDSMSKVSTWHDYLIELQGPSSRLLQAFHGQNFWLLWIMKKMFERRFVVRREFLLVGNREQLNLGKEKADFSKKIKLLKVILSSEQMFQAISSNVFALKELQYAVHSGFASVIKERNPTAPFLSKKVLMRKVYVFYCGRRKGLSLRELSAISVFRHKIPYQTEHLPAEIIEYLNNFLNSSVERIAAEISEEDEISAFPS